MNAEIPSSAPEHPTLTHHFTVLLSPTSRGVRLARRLSAERLDTWGFPYDTPAHHTAVLLIAELSTNAMLHGRLQGRDFRLRLLLTPITLRIEVTDARPERRPPLPGTLTPAPAGADGGRGLLLVEGLSERWGTECGDPFTKTVWCEVALK